MTEFYISLSFTEKFHQRLEFIVVQNCKQLWNLCFDILSFKFKLVNEKISDHTCKKTQNSLLPIDVSSFHLQRLHQNIHGLCVKKHVNNLKYRFKMIFCKIQSSVLIWVYLPYNLSKWAGCFLYSSKSWADSSSILRYSGIRKSAFPSCTCSSCIQPTHTLSRLGVLAHFFCLSF